MAAYHRRRDEHPLPRTDSWTPSNLNLSAQGAMVEEARADGCAWSPSYLNLEKSEECLCPPGQPLLESPLGREQDVRSGPSCRTIGEGDQQQSARGIPQPVSPAPDPQAPCICKSRGGGEEQLVVHSPTPSVDRRPEPPPPPPPPPVYLERCVNVCPGLCKGPDVGSHASPDAPWVHESQPREKKYPESVSPFGPQSEKASRSPSATQRFQPNIEDLTALEDTYVWEARSYTGSAESEEMEKLRQAGRAPMPVEPGARSEEELGRPVPQERRSYTPQRERTVEEAPSPASRKPSETKPKDGGREGPDTSVTAIEDVYVWEARSYTGSADSDALEVLRLAGKSPMPKGPGERSEGEESTMEHMRPEEAVPERTSPEQGGFPSDGRCFPTCPGVCKNLPWPPPCSSTVQKTPSATVRAPPSQDVPRRPCGCRFSTEQLPVTGEQGAGGAPKPEKKPEKKPCLCDPGDQEPHPKCVCKHCQKKRMALEQSQSQPQWDYQLSADPYNGPPYQPGDEKGFPDSPPEGPIPAGGAEPAVCPPCPPLDAKPSAQSTVREPMQMASQGRVCDAVIGLREAASAKCFCKPTVHDRVEYLTNLLKQGISPLRRALEEIENKMRAMGFSEFGSDGKPQLVGSGAMAPYGGASIAPSGGGLGASGKEPAVAIYIMAPSAALSTSPPQMVPSLPQQSQITAGASMHGKNSCKCILAANKMNNLGTVLEENEMLSDRKCVPDDKITLYFRGNCPGALNQEVCCPLPCCQHRPRSAQPYSKP